MALSGSLEDISLVDVMQILALSRKSGELRVFQEDRHAEISFLDGRLIGGQLSPRRLFMSDLLIEHGRISREALLQALALQREPEFAHRPIGAVLIAMGAVDRITVEWALRQYLQLLVNEVAAWEEGLFEFTQGTPEPPDDLRVLPGELGVPGIQPQELLLEALRLLDESSRKGSVPGEEDPLVALGPDQSGRQLIIHSSDVLVRHAFRERCAEEGIELSFTHGAENLRSRLVQAAGRCPLVVFDIDAGEGGESAPAAGLPLIEALAQELGFLAIVTFGTAEDPAVYARVVTAGVAAHVPRPGPLWIATPGAAQHFLAALQATVSRALEAVTYAGPEESADAGRAWAGAPRLYHALVAMRRNAHSTTVSLGMLRYVAEQLERAILFVVRPQELTAIGMFGIDPARGVAPDGAHPLRLPLDAGTLVHSVIETREGRWAESITADPLLRFLVERIGPPNRPECMLIPLLVNQQVIAIVYADNGRKEGPLVPGEALAIMVEHASLCMENLLLRRLAGQRREDGHRSEASHV